MHLRTMLIIGLALLFGLSAAYGVNLVIRDYAKGIGSPVETVEVVVAAKDINRFTVVTPDLVTTRQVQKNLVPKEALLKTGDALERVALLKCGQGEILLNSQLAKKGSSMGVGAATPSGMRAFSIRTARISGAVTGFILPGDRVDVLLTVNAPAETKQGTVTLTLLTNIEVLAVNQVTNPMPNKSGQLDDLKTVTLLVTPEQASKLALGENKGELHLSLRNPSDTIPVPPTKIGLKDIGLAEVRPTEAPPVQPPAQPAALPSPPPELEPAPEPVKETYSVQFREGTKVGTKIFVLDERGHFVLDRIEYGTGATDAQAPAPPPGKKGAIKPANNSGPLK